jgi:hypothetical protein
VNLMSCLSEVSSAQLAAWVSAISGTALAVLSFWLGLPTKTLAKETRLSREAGERADIQCAIEPHEEHVNLLELVIANVGAAAAEHVRVSIEPWRIGAEHKSQTFSWTCLLPGTRFRILLRSYPNLPAKVTKTCVIYHDKFGRHESRFEQDIQGWAGFSQISHQPNYSIADLLKKIERTFDGWNGFHRLKIDVFDKADRDWERHELEKRWKRQEPDIEPLDTKRLPTS